MNNTQFMVLKTPSKNYTNQTSMETSKVKKMLAATLQYDVDTLAPIIFLGGNYAGEYRNGN